MSAWSIVPPEASVMAHRIDVLFFTLVAVSSVVIGGIGALIAYFCIRYRAGASADRSNPVARNRTLEYFWIFTPLVIFLGIFGWAAALYAELYQPPPDAIEITVVGKQWMWKLQHPEGRREINELHVPVGRPVRLVMTSQDVIHSFFVPALRIKQDVVPGRYVSMWFTPNRTGEFHLFCAEMCGTGHSTMTGRVIVMPPTAYARWIAQGAPLGSMAAEGGRLFRSVGCSGCHGANANIHAPKLEGLFRSVVHLDGGGTMVADETYLRDSILEPRKAVVAGYSPIMPSFQGQLDEHQLFALVEYIKSLPAERTRQ
jgi:cytochrome c oxidase subunit II